MQYAIAVSKSYGSPADFVTDVVEPSEKVTVVVSFEVLTDVGVGIGVKGVKSLKS